MKIERGKEGIKLSFQDNFPEEATCGDCQSMARLALVLQENGNPICNLYKNGEDGFWPHDYIAVAIYFCRNCRKAITLWNQG